MATLCVCSPSALGAGAWWRVSARAAPTNLQPGKPGLITAYAVDVGDRGVGGATSEITLTDVLPAGTTVTEGQAVKAHRSAVQEEENANWECTVGEAGRRVSCGTHWAVPAFEPLVLEIPVSVEAPQGASVAPTNVFTVSGGEAQGGGSVSPVGQERPLLVNGQGVTFGVEEDGYAIVPEEEGGASDSRAGSHPFQLTSTLDFNQTLEEVQGPHEAKVRYAPGAPALPKNLSFQLPPGLLGNITATERCTALQFSTQRSADNLCPASSVVGVANVTLLEPSRLGYITFPVPLFNMVPEEGEPARFGFDASEVPVILDTSVRTGGNHGASSGDYGVTVSVNGATQAAQVLGAQITFWGTPGAAAHDESRGWACLRDEVENDTGKPCQAPATHSEVPLLTLPTSCTGALLTSMSGEAWTGETVQAQAALQGSSGELLESIEGCSDVPFEPAIATVPVEEQEGQGEAVAHDASTPAGLDVRVKVPQAGTLDAQQLADADVKDSTVTLPAGVTLDPAAASGLEACSETEVGYEGPASEPDPLEPGAAQPLRFDEAPVSCPMGSRLGSVEIRTPLLSQTLTGSVYLAEPAPNGGGGKNPFGSLIALYIVAESKELGLRVKLAGEGSLDPQTGQITTTFRNTPQVPFEELQLQLQGGPRGSISTPAHCGVYATEAQFTPWSASAPYTTHANPTNPGEEFLITNGPGGGPCPGDSLPFAPTFQAGSASSQAGTYTQFALHIQNPDGDQALSSLTMHLPAGVAAQLSNVTPCPEPQASRNECGPDSLIGHSTAYSGLGPDPVSLAGQVYLTGPYEDAPFGISVVTPAVAGPFNLGDVTVRSRINVDPNTAAVTIASDPFPTFVKGVPVDLKRIDVLVDRPDFEFNPTSCVSTSINATLTGAQGATSSPSQAFQVSGCGNLPFKPVFQASTSGNATKANGASFVVKVTSKGLGEADIEKVDLQLPKALPARLTTLQKACTEGAFNANPASCPEGSVIGTAVIHTPVLKNPLSGPAYLVSHGGAAFPDVEFVLQGENITLVLDGKTAIKSGVTYSKFEAAPDAPFTTFETILPQGPHSALTSNVPAKAKFSLCGQTLQMPTEITAHNGTLIKQTTKIAVQGCKAVKASRAKKLTRAQQLALALKHCRKTFKHSRHKRQACERQARKRYAAKKTSARKHRASKAHKARTSS
jgi:hypothetical protein